MARATDQNKEEFKALLQTMDTKSVANFDKVTLIDFCTLIQLYFRQFYKLIRQCLTFKMGQIEIWNHALQHVPGRLCC